MAALVLWSTVLASFLLVISLSVNSTAQDQLVPAMFVFGDSLVDAGNNNNLVTLAKANFPPYGVDFSAGVTGRFCNGGTVADHLGDLLGLPLIPPFNNPNTNGSAILNGVNYGSAASGILNETGKFNGDIWDMNSQIQNFKKTLLELSEQLGGETADFVGKSLFVVCTGNNDYLINYMLPFSDKPKKYTPYAYAQFLVEQFGRQLKDLYDLGGRKFLIAGLPPLGCTPNQIAISGKNSSSCVERTNQLASVFNTQLKAMLDEQNTNLTGTYFLYWDTYTFLSDVINNYSQYGFEYQHSACCGGGRANGKIICLPLLPLECHNRTQFVFWDPSHPTDALNVLASENAYKGPLQNTYPRNVQELIQM